MPNSDVGASSRRPFLAALAGLFLVPFLGRADVAARPYAAAVGAGDATDGDAPARESFIGQIVLIPTDWIPRGSEHPISNHQALFSILGTKFGGDGRRTFGVPDVRAPKGLRYVISSTGIFPSRH